MEPKRDLAIVLRSVPFQDRHKVITALTESHGLITALARNSVQSRRFGGSLDLFSASLWHFSEKPGAELAQLQQAEIRRPFEGIRRDFERLAVASIFSEIMLRVAPQNQDAPELFKLHSNALAAVDELSPGEAVPFSLLNAYITKILQWSGSQPQLQQCRECQASLDTLTTQTEITCIVADAAWVCPGCRTQGTRHVQERSSQSFGSAALRVKAIAVHDFHRFLGLPIRQIPAACAATQTEHRELFGFLEALLVYHVPGFDRQPLKSLKFLELGSNLPPAQSSRR